MFSRGGACNIFHELFYKSRLYISDFLNKERIRIWKIWVEKRRGYTTKSQKRKLMVVRSR